RESRGHQSQHLALAGGETGGKYVTGSEGTVTMGEGGSDVLGLREGELGVHRGAEGAHFFEQARGRGRIVVCSGEVSLGEEGEGALPGGAAGIGEGERQGELRLRSWSVARIGSEDT